ncbi:MAG: tetratricopeptide repeat protein [Candidatus Cloacimonetes bacterium]|nr:tetratricopeptide repeat protein [Candidatus Cloacimonadota bacterium]
MIQISNEHGAYFNKIDFSEKGGYVLIIFGAPLSTEKIFMSSAHFAIKIQKLFGNKIRIGLTGGTAFTGFIGSELREEYTVLGMVVNKSVRIVMKTEWGQIVIDENIQKKINKHFSVNNLGNFELKGFSETFNCFELLKATSKKFQNFSSNQFVGRVSELQYLQKNLDTLEKYKNIKIIHIEGEAGIGKSRLLYEFQKKLDTENYNWFYMSCGEIVRTSFKPLIYFLHNYFDQQENVDQTTNLALFNNKIEKLIKSDISEVYKKELIRSKSFISALLGFFETNSLFEQVDASGKFDNTLIALKNIILLECSLKPLIIEIDDAHWIDRDTITFLKYLLQDNPEISLLLLICSRIKPDGLKLSLNLAQISENRIIIEKLSKTITQRLVKEIFNCNIIPLHTLEMIYNISDGNPFYIEQFAMFLFENKIIDSSYKIRKTKIDIPQSISSIIIARVDKLSYELKEVINTASVLGREFIIEILSAMLKKTSIQKYLKDGENEAIWDSINEIKYIFKHAILRETVYEMQLKKQLRKLHKLAGDTIVEVFSDEISNYYGELSYHFEKADDQEKAIDFLEKAGDFSRKNYRNHDAIDYYTRVLNLLEKDILIDEIFSEKIDKESLKTIKKTISIRIDLRHVLNNIGSWDEALKCSRNNLNIAEKTGIPELIAETNLDFAQQLYESGDYEKSLELCEVALKHIENPSTSDKYYEILNTQGQNYIDTAKYDEALKVFQKVLEISEKRNNKTMISIVQTNMGVIYSLLGDLNNAMKFLKNSLKVAEELKDLVGVAKILNDIGTVYQQFQDFENALIYLNKTIKLSNEIGYKGGLGIAYGNIGVIYRQQGKQEKALEFYHLKLQISIELGDKKGLTIVYGTLGNLFLDKGDTKKAMMYQQRSLKFAEETDDLSSVSVTLGNIGEIYVREKDLEKGLEYYERAIKIDKEINFYHHLSYVYAQKNHLLLKLKRFSEAKNMLAESKSIASKVGDQMAEFELDINECKINFELSEDIQEKQLWIEKLLAKLADETDDYKITIYHYEIALLSAKINRLDSELLDKAIDLCQKLYDNNPNEVHKKMVDELKEVKKNK